uniref:Uncharacterized protein n=1 Tax=Arundo donax TaxID=35708 RepID=A0A0A9CL63_ARUDO
MTYGDAAAEVAALALVVGVVGGEYAYPSSSSSSDDDDGGATAGSGRRNWSSFLWFPMAGRTNSPTPLAIL